ncbi:hypothetical protein ACWEQA_00685 [Nocardia sp. NPDC004085]
MSKNFYDNVEELFGVSSKEITDQLAFLGIAVDVNQSVVEMTEEQSEKAEAIEHALFYARFGGHLPSGIYDCLQQELVAPNVSTS